MAKQIGKPNQGRPIAEGKIETIDPRIAQKTVLTQWAQRRIKQGKMIFCILIFANVNYFTQIFFGVYWFEYFNHFIIAKSKKFMVTNSKLNVLSLIASINDL